MSAQKLSEAERLLERGKVTEAIQALKSLVAGEPGNQTYVTKLADAYAQAGDAASAVAVLLGYAKRIAKAGKPQLAVAILKQALDHDPHNVGLLEEYAAQCEASGKLSEAANAAQKALSILLPRKRYFDALNIMPLLVRVVPKDNKLKAAWVEVMSVALAEQKLIHLLVALLGPPGLTSEIFETGGDPTELPEDLFQSVAALVPWFPRDPKIPYALAWGHYRRGNRAHCCSLLREALRRDPDFTMAALLFARILAEDGKLNECLFVFRYVKERAISDRQVPSPVLNKQIAAFEEKNGWISFSEGDASEMSAENFLAAVRGEGGDEATREGETAGADGARPAGAAASQDSAKGAGAGEVTLPGMVELGGDGGSGAIILTSGEERKISEQEAAVALPEVSPASVPEPEEPPRFETEAPQAALPEISQEAEAEPEPVTPPASEAPEIPAAPVLSPLDLILSQKKEAATDRRVREAPPSPEEKIPEVTVSAEEPAPLEEREEATQVIAPAQLREMLAASTDSPESSEEPLDPTKSPLDAVAAFSPLPAAAVVDESAQEKTEGVSLSLGKEALLEFTGQVLGQQSPAESKGSPEKRDGDADKTVGMPAEQAEFEPGGQTGSLLASIRETEFTSPLSAVKAAQERGFDFEESKKTEVDQVDLGDDLLAEATRMISLEGSATQATDRTAEKAALAPDEATKASEITRPVDAAAAAPGSELAGGTQGGAASVPGEARVEELLAMGDRHLASGKFPAARRAYRQALAQGADPAIVREKLGSVRSRELPDSLYSRLSTDEPQTESISEIVDRLVSDFHLENDAPSFASDGLRIDVAGLTQKHDAGALLELGVGLLEMGLAPEAEFLWEHVRRTGAAPERWKASGLAAESRRRRGDYPGAVAILRRLVSEPGMPESEKVPLWFSLGESLERMKRVEESRQCFLEVSRIDPNYRNVRGKV